MDVINWLKRQFGETVEAYDEGIEREPETHERRCAAWLAEAWPDLAGELARGIDTRRLLPGSDDFARVKEARRRHGARVVEWAALHADDPLMRLATPEFRVPTEDPMSERAYFAVDWADIGQAMAPWWLEVIEGRRKAPEKVSIYVAPAIQLRREGWGLAQYPRDTAVSGEERQWRSNALELCRLAFTALLHEHVERPIGVHIVGDKSWRF